MCTNKHSGLFKKKKLDAEYKLKFSFEYFAVNVHLYCIWWKEDYMEADSVDSWYFLLFLNEEKKSKSEDETFGDYLVGSIMCHEWFEKWKKHEQQEIM